MLVTAALYTLCITFSDLSGRSYGEHGWAPFVLVVDYLLVMGVNERYAFGVVCGVSLWLIILAFEEAFRYGLLDMPGLYPQEGEFGRREVFRKKMDCTDLPCPTGQMQSVLYMLQVFVIDFVATRGFAREILKEQATMERTINTVQEIASLLAGYDVERVAELLAEHHGQLPEEMTSALRSLEENLRVYKAYLPQTCLPFEEEMPLTRGMSATVMSSIAESSLSSSMSHSTVSGLATMCRTANVLALTPTKATLLTLNIKDTLLCLEKDATSFSELFTAVLLKTLQTTDLQRGMVDVFVGDRIHCSFNASKQCANHATSALHTATMLMQGGDEVSTHVNMGVAMGKVLRGDMGCHVMRRFSMVGALVRDVLAIERAGRILGCDVLCNRLCFSDAECEHDLRLIPCKVELAAHCEPEVLGELVVPAVVATATRGEEWMYQIGGKKDWEDYNQAVRGYLKGETSAEAVQSASLIGNCALHPVRVKAAPLKCAVFSFQGGGWGVEQ